MVYAHGNNLFNGKKGPWAIYFIESSMDLLTVTHSKNLHLSSLSSS